MKEKFRAILNCENSKERQKKVTQLFDSLSDQSSEGLQKTFMEFLKFAQEEDPKTHERLVERLADELELETDIGEFGFGGDWWKAVGENDES